VNLRVGALHIRECDRNEKGEMERQQETECSQRRRQSSVGYKSAIYRPADSKSKMDRSAGRIRARVTESCRAGAVVCAVSSVTPLYPMLPETLAHSRSREKKNRFLKSSDLSRCQLQITVELNGWKTKQPC